MQEKQISPFLLLKYKLKFLWDKYGHLVLLILLIIYAIPVTIYIVTGTLGSHGGTDLHPYWYWGYFVRHGHDPYLSFFENKSPDLPAIFLDGTVVVNPPLAQPGLTMEPAFTAAFFLFSSMLSFFSWPIAKFIWFVLNLILVIATFLMLSQKIPFGSINLSSKISMGLILLIYYDFSATRITIENGQASLLIFLFMLGAIYYIDKSWFLSGLFLGAALCKYSLAIPLVIFFLYRKKFPALITAAGLQALGVIGISIPSGSSFFGILSENLQMFFMFLGHWPGVDLGSFLGSSPLTVPILFLFTVITMGLPLYWINRYKISSLSDIAQFHILTILMLWGMLISYHRIYDSIVILFLVILVFKGLQANIWMFANTEKSIISIVFSLIIFMLILPAKAVDAVFTGYYDYYENILVTLLLLGSLGIAIFLFFRYVKNSDQSFVEV